MQGKKIFLVVVLLVVLTGTMPYLYAQHRAGEHHVFGGFLINYQDGNSYLAKMRQGMEGEWTFDLPYSAQTGPGGAGLFLFYLTLGHLARLTGLSLLAVYHIFRVAGTIFMLWALSWFFEKVFVQPSAQRAGFILASFGAGLGWLALAFGAFTMDFWVAEAYPWLTSYTNPHFVIGLALMLLLLAPDLVRSPVLAGILSLGLGIIQPFGVVLVAAVLGGGLILDWALGPRRGLKDWLGKSIAQKVVAVAFMGGVVLLYQYWVIINHPQLAGWNAQNQTPTPPLWDVAWALSPCLPLAVLGLKRFRLQRGKDQAHTRILYLWLGLALILSYVPWNLQRRFLTGVMVPTAGAAVLGLQDLKNRISLPLRKGIILVLGLSLPTIAVILASGAGAAAVQDSQIYLTQSEYQVLDWLNDQVREGDLVLTRPRMGLYVPVYTGARVLYGHPFETIQAEEMRSLVEDVYQGKFNDSELGALLHELDVDYVLVDPQYDKGNTPDFDQWGSLVYQRKDIRVFKIPGSG